MTTQLFLDKCRELLGELPPQPPSPPEAPQLDEADSLIGLFQHFRPDGSGIEQLFESLELGDELSRRLAPVYEVAGDDRRPSGGRDAYFVIRKPSKLPVETAEHHASTWIEGLASIANWLEDPESEKRLRSGIKIRVLEGTAPKPPKFDHEKSDLFKVFRNEMSVWTAGLNDLDQHAQLLRPAYYFLACDAMLRDYLMWPFYRSRLGLDDPLRGYFLLWSHGVKYRIFGDDQIDLYLPRHAE